MAASANYASEWLKIKKSYSLKKHVWWNFFLIWVFLIRPSKMFMFFFVERKLENLTLYPMGNVLKLFSSETNKSFDSKFGLNDPW